MQQLKKSNAELEAQAGELNDKAKLLEVKNNEVELASRSLEEKAEQLQLISKYKSEFLANMSHELRTPLNSLLILVEDAGREPRRQPDRRAGEVRADRLHVGRRPALALINEILDLSKVEAGKMPIDPRSLQALPTLRDNLEQDLPPRRRSEGHRVRDPRRAGMLPRKLFTGREDACSRS